MFQRDSVQRLEDSLRAAIQTDGKMTRTGEILFSERDVQDALAIISNWRQLRAFADHVTPLVMGDEVDAGEVDMKEARRLLMFAGFQFKTDDEELAEIESQVGARMSPAEDVS